MPRPPASAPLAGLALALLLALPAHRDALATTVDRRIASNAAPVVNAGPDQSIPLLTFATLDGTVSDDGLPGPPATLTTLWNRVSGPGTVTFQNPNAVDTQASFAATGTYILRLTANDGELAASDSIRIVVLPPGQPSNAAPVVNAGANQTITLPDDAVLDATVSDDGLPNPPGALTTTWNMASGPAAVTFQNANAVDTRATFSAAGTYVLRLTAADGQLSTSATVQIAVAPQPPVNVAPVVDAGAAQAITLPADAVLDGTVSDDGLPNPPGALTTTWSMASGPAAVSFQDASVVDTRATFAAAGTYVLRLTAFDGALSASDTVQISVAPEPPPPNIAPVVSAGPAQSITLPADAILDGTVSDDGLPNPPGALTTTWSTASGPAAVTFQNASAVDTRATFSTAGTYVLRLTAADGELSTPATVQITVAPASVPATTITRGPYLQCGTPTSVVVRWRTAAATDTRVDCGTAANNLSTTFSNGVLTTEHEIVLSGLAPATRYWYGVGSSAGLLAADATCTFVTPPATGTAQPVRAWILGDSGEAGAVQSAVRDAFLAYTGARGADLMLMLGDNAYSSGTDADYQAGMFAPYAASLRQCVLWPTRGNHDQLHSGANNDYYDLFTMPAQAQAGGVASGTEAYYSYDHANVHFVCVDSEGSDNSPTGSMVTWLRADLAATSQDWIVAYWHHPPYSKGSHNSDNESGLRNMRQNVVPVMDQLGVDLVLCGHSHAYERSFLLRSHYGRSGTLVDSMKVDAGDGRRNGNGPYHKLQQQTPFAGAVYAVAGSSSHTGGGSLNHPVMVSSQDVPGSLVLDVNGETLDMRFLSSTGAVTDSFTILKGSVVSVGAAPTPGSGFAFLRVAPQPSSGAVDLTYRLPRSGRARVEIFGDDGRRIATVSQGEEQAGERRARWDGRDAGGKRVAAGVYFAVVEFGGERRAMRVVLTP